MLPKLLTLLGLIIQVGQVALDAYVRVREILPLRKKRILSDVETHRMKKLQMIRSPLTRDEINELLELEKRDRDSKES